MLTWHALRVLVWAAHLAWAARCIAPRPAAACCIAPRPAGPRRRREREGTLQEQGGTLQEQGGILQEQGGTPQELGDIPQERE
eukprot:5354489-Pyramimonas_sp.AAC.2